MVISDFSDTAPLLLYRHRGINAQVRRKRKYYAMKFRPPDMYFLSLVFLLWVMVAATILQVLTTNTAPQHQNSGAKEKQPTKSAKKTNIVTLYQKSVRRKRLKPIFDAQKHQVRSKEGDPPTKSKSSDYDSNDVNGVVDSNRFKGHLQSQKTPPDGVLAPGLTQGAFMWLHEDRSILLYSAHYDHRSRSILFIGFKHRYIEHADEPEAICIIPAGSISPVYFTPYYNISLVESPNQAIYDTMIWSCQLAWSIMIPQQVILGYAMPDKPASFARMKVSSTNYGLSSPDKLKFVVCVKPLLHGYGDVQMLMEYIQMAKMFGASKIVMYSQEVQGSLLRAFYQFQHVEKILDIYDWITADGIMYNRGEKAAQQHCLQTYRYQAEFLVFLDFNEMLVPEGNITTWSGVVEEAEKLHSSGSNEDKPSIKTQNIGIIKVPMRQIKLSSTDDEVVERTSLPAQCHINPILKTQASLLIPEQSVIMARPEAIQIVDSYRAREIYTGYTEVTLPSSKAIIHRYITKSPVTEWHPDRTMHKFISPLSNLMGPFCAEHYDLS